MCKDRIAQLKHKSSANINQLIKTKVKTEFRKHGVEERCISRLASTKTLCAANERVRSDTENVSYSEGKKREGMVCKPMHHNLTIPRNVVQKRHRRPP